MIAGLLFVLLSPDPATPPARAEVCLAYVNAMIVEASRETGRVAGPSWFVRDWWTERLPGADAPGALTEDQRTALAESMPGRKTADPDVYRDELRGCVREAIDGGAVPGMGPG